MWAETRVEALLLAASTSQPSVPAATPPGQRKRLRGVGFNQEGDSWHQCLWAWRLLCQLGLCTSASCHGGPPGVSPGGVAFLGTELVLACLRLPRCTSARETEASEPPAASVPHLGLKKLSEGGEGSQAGGTPASQ